MKNNEQDTKLSQLLRSWETPQLDLPNVEFNVRCRIAAERLEPKGWDGFVGLVLAWKQAFTLRPAVGAVVAMLAVIAGWVGGSAVASSNTTRIAEQEKIHYVSKINPLVQASRL